METLADYGVGSYFGLSTFTTGIYRAWLSMNDATAAAQLASMLLVLVAVLLALERRAQARLRFSATQTAPPHSARSASGAPARRRGAGRSPPSAPCRCCSASCCPRSWLGAMLWREAAGNSLGLPLGRFAAWAWSSFQARGLRRAAGHAAGAGPRLRAASPGVAAARSRWCSARRILSLGYAIPGAVVAIGILLPLAWLQARWPASGIAALVHRHGARRAVRLPGALFGRGAAVGGGRLRPRADRHRRHRAHARRRSGAACSAGSTCRCCADRR